jgi:hypothetical protein
MTYAHIATQNARVSVGNVGCLFSIANIANKPQFIQWCVCIQYCAKTQCIQPGLAAGCWRPTWPTNVSEHTLTAWWSELEGGGGRAERMGQR